MFSQVSLAWQRLGMGERKRTSSILGNIITTMGLVDPDLSSLSHVVEVLSGVHTGFQGSGPAGGVDGRSFVFGVLEGLPVDHEGDGVFGLFDAVVRLGGGDTRRCGGDDSGKKN